MNATIHVVLVEDDTLLRDSLASYLGLIGFSVTAVGDCLSLYGELTSQRFDVAVVDLGLPDQSGEVLVDYLRRNTESAIIVITARDTLDTRVECYRVGADLFLGKPVDGRELAAAISSLAARRSMSAVLPSEVPGPQATSSAAWIFQARQRILTSPEAIDIELTPKESQLLTALLARAGKTVRRDLLLEAIYHRQDESSDRALDTLVRRTRHKIETATGIPAPILTEHGVGYAFVANFRSAED
jgi:two-component system OmpR family response regulator/two-component system response regulator TctD